MVRLSAQQEKFITRLKNAWEDFDRANRELDAQYRMQKEVLKDPIRALVAEALEEGIPARQIAVKGLGYADVGSLKQFTTARAMIPGSWAEAISPVGPTRAKVKVQDSVSLEHNTRDEEIVATDEYGERVGFSYFGSPTRLYGGVEWDEFTGNKDGVREALKRDFPGVIIDGE